MSSLEPRTHHQPGKRWKLSKNEVGFTLHGIRVNEKHAPVTPAESIECSSSTSPCPEMVQPLRDSSFLRKPLTTRHLLGPRRLTRINTGQNTLSPQTRMDAGFASINSLCTLRSNVNIKVKSPSSKLLRKSQNLRNSARTYFSIHRDIRPRPMFLAHCVYVGCATHCSRHKHESSRRLQ